jgi:hypothetical protein
MHTEFLSKNRKRRDHLHDIFKGGRCSTEFRGKGPWLARTYRRGRTFPYMLNGVSGKRDMVSPYVPAWRNISLHEIIQPNVYLNSMSAQQVTNVSLLSTSLKGEGYTFKRDNSNRTANSSQGSITSKQGKCSTSTVPRLLQLLTLNYVARL